MSQVTLLAEINRERGSPSAASAAPAPRLVAIDVLRGLAALVVMVFHYTCWYPTHLGHAFPLPRLEWGRYGVQVFFIISGFVILMTLERTADWRDFAVSRFSRLYPCYWVGIALTWTIVYASGVPMRSLNGREVLINLTMVQSAFHVPHVDGVYWTLQVELLFYVMMGAALAFGRLRQVEWVLLLLAILHLLDVLVLPASMARAGLVGIVREALILDQAALFGVGVMLYRLWSARRDGMRIALLLFFVIAGIVRAPGAVQVIVPMATMLVWLAATGRLAWANQRGLVALGIMSYPFYLLHQNIGYAMLHMTLQHGLAWWAALPIAMTVSLALAWAVSRWIEYPAMRAIRRRYRERRRPFRPAACN